MIGIGFLICVFGIGIINLLLPSKKISEEENRGLQQKPEISVSAVTSGSYMDQYEKYQVDQFMGRNMWRSLKVGFSRLAGSKEENGVFIGKKGQLLEDIAVPDQDVLKEKVNQYISEFRSELDMEKEGCYARPKYTKDSKEVQAACDTMNKYLKASITYTMSESVVVDKTLISTWIGVDDNMNVVFDNDAMKAWFTEFGDKYDTVGTTRNLTTPTGKATTVTGGTYGWSIDEDTELVNLQNSIKNGEVVTREPAYYTGGAAKSHGEQDWGTTFIEVDLSTQHMWYLKDGSVAMETDVVTGVPVPERITPEGVYDILEMTRDEVLIGETDPSTGKPIYETPVNYWMRVTWTGIGFHDATWQAAFGGTRYKDGAGSHGCINMPLDQAAALFGMISVGTPVVIHY